MTHKLVGYELFLPRVVLAIRAKTKVDSQVTDEEIKLITELAFRDAVARFMKDSELYTVQLPVDIYQDTKRYDIVPPEDFLVVDIVGFKEHKTRIPKLNYDLKNINLDCCPDRDIQEAFYVEVALMVRRSAGVCKFDGEFIDMYYDAILAAMMVQLMEAPEQKWFSRFSSSLHRMFRNEYRKALGNAVRKDLNGGAPIKLKVRRFSGG